MVEWLLDSTVVAFLSGLAVGWNVLPQPAWVQALKAFFYGPQIGPDDRPTDQ